MECSSSDENSNDGLQIVIDSPRPKRKARMQLDENDKQIIACVEKDLEENLEEKAAKANLNANHVKNILKQVVTNEHVLALVRNAENPEAADQEPIVYEPKYTRAKTKELLSTNIKTNILPWVPPPKPPSSEVQVLFSEELQDDDSGDEYIPKKSIPKEVLDISSSAAEEQANIALRTRSKLSLSNTALEEIEGGFMPPDITTDMYDMDCDDDVWKEFLKTFTKPLDEVTKAAEDEDHDPEYNILADEEIDEVDKEELRADRAVTVSRKEFNCLMAELFEFADIYEKSNNKTSEKHLLDANNSVESPKEEIQSGNQVGASDIESDDDPNITIKRCQIPILAQQMRQHVQMLIQNFLLAYEHPEFSDMATDFKELLLSIKEGGDGKSVSIFHVENLQPALDLMDQWEELFASGSEEVVEAKKYVEKVLAESIQAKLAGTEYIVTFPELILRTISNSPVFIYPNLLPRIPFKSLNITSSPLYIFSHSEESLIAQFLEQAIPVLKQDPFHLTKTKKLNMLHVCHYINKYLMPLVPPTKIRCLIRRRSDPNAQENPIKFYYRHKKTQPVVHYVVPLDAQQMLPPCKKRPEALPYQWREYNFPRKQKSEQNDVQNNKNVYQNQIILVSSPLKLWPVLNTTACPSYNVNFSKNVIAQRKIQPKGPLPPILYNTRKRRRKRRSVISSKPETERINIKENQITVNMMLPDMPSLGGAPMNNQSTETENGTKSSAEPENTQEKRECELSFQNIANSGFQFYKPESNASVRHTFEGVCESLNTQNETVGEKDNPDDINELMIASSTVKNKKEPSGAEKKRAKIRREFVANIAMATPDVPEIQAQKEDNFVDVFYDKLRETLSTDEYDKLIEIMGNYDESKGEFVGLYNNIQSILLPKYKELSDEFLLFLTDIQAHKVGQLMPYFLMKDMSRFMKKLQAYFKEQPTQMKKIIKALTEVAENPNITMDMVKNTLLPLLKGNVALTDWFLQLFPRERPPSLLSNGPHEVIDICKELARQPDEEIFETIIMPESDDPYGGPSCICSCHNAENPHFKSRSSHCLKCGLKFMQGKIYVQTGKALRPAIVSFLTNPEKDHTKRLSAIQRKRSDSSPNKQVTSPNKENSTQEENRHHNNSNDSEDECDGKKKTPRIPKTQRKRTVQPNALKEPGKTSNIHKDKIKSENVKSCKTVARKLNKRRSSGKNVIGFKPGSSSGQQKRLAEQSEPEIVEPKISSGHSGDSESECLGSSQDITYTDSEDSVPSSSNQSENLKTQQWTREEDKIILQAFRQTSDNEETFNHLSEVLQNRSVIEIKNRFNKLMNLLQKMAARSTATT